MKLGAVFPQLEIGTDVAVLKDYLATVEGLGYDHILIYDHVLGVDPSARGDWAPPGHTPYGHDSDFHEPLTFFAWAAALTSRIELATGILILPQRQTALAAKQIAEIQNLSGGRLRLGLGVGWNEPEMRALGADYSTRGRRIESQIALLRRLWTEPSIAFEDEWHTIQGLGLSPRPLYPIPIWLGGDSPRVIARAAKMADGWILRFGSPEKFAPSLDLLRKELDKNGRDPAGFGLEGRADLASRPVEHAVDRAAAWRDAGATHLTLNTMGADLPISEHLDRLRRFKEAWASQQT